MRVAILSDIHEDYESLPRVVAKAEAKGFDKLICLGDISGFSLPFYKYGESRNASACLALLREKCDIIIIGNHDLHAAGIDPELPDDLKDKDTCQHELDLDPGYSEEDISFLATLPFYDILTTPTGNILFSHYVYPNLTGFVKGFNTEEKDFQVHFAFMQEHNCKLSFTGHAHPRGFYIVNSSGLNHYHSGGIKITTFPALIGIPPVTRTQDRCSFGIFDTISRKLQVFK